MVSGVAARGLSVVAFAMSVAVGVPSARADVVAPPEGGVCPIGTDPGGSHGINPAFCRPRSCSTDADCTGGLVCGAVPLCTDGYWATKTCPNGDECQGSYPCTELRVCATADQLDEAEEAGGCGCRVASGGGSTRGLIGVALVALLFGFRRPRRRAS